MFADNPTWRIFLPVKYEGEKHPANKNITDRLMRLRDAVTRATAMSLGGGRSSWPVLTTRLPPESPESIRDLHRTSDWVVTADRNVCIEYFDSPKEARSVYDGYIIDCVPERSDLGCLQLVTSTCNLDEVRNLFDEMLGEMGLSSSARNCEFLLWHLKGLSGRLAIRLASEGTKAGELVALALVHAACATAKPGSPVWLSLTEGFFIPLDETSDVLPSAKSAAGDDLRADLVFVTAASRKRLEFRFVEVKFRRHLRVARSNDLLEKMVAQTSAIRRRWDECFFGGKTAVTRALRRSALGRLLRFYVDKARRHYLTSEAYERICREIDNFLVQGDGYTLSEPERPECGYILCPELRTVEFERLFLPGNETADLFLVGITDLPDRGVSATTTPADQEQSANFGESSGSGESSALGASAEAAVSETLPAGATPGPVDILLGRNVANEERVHWRLSIKSNPHLMVVGLPGMGKTTCLVNICHQLHAAGITPIIFSFHQDIDEKLEATCGPVNGVDYDGLGFNPLQVSSTSVHAHVDVASELRDIFGAIFPDLEISRPKYSTSDQAKLYRAWLGQGRRRRRGCPGSFIRGIFRYLTRETSSKSGGNGASHRAFRLWFFQQRRNSSRPFDLRGPSVVRIHRTSNELLQRAFASFVLYSIYKDMFKRGPQTALTHAVIFDEAHRASRLRLLPTMAKECRKFGLSLVLASQEVRDFDPSLFSAIASYLALRVTENDARTVARMVASSDVEKRIIDRLKQIPKYTALFFTEGSTRPTTVALADEPTFGTIRALRPGG